MDPCSTYRDAHLGLRWMTGRTLNACEELTTEEFRRPFPIGIGSVHSTLVHLAGAERIWISVLECTDAAASMPDPAALPDVAAVRASLAESRSRWDRFLDGLVPEEGARVVERVRDGKTYRQTVGDVLMQVPTHALYHNAQLSFMFRSMGRTMPDSSWILWARERIDRATG